MKKHDYAQNNSTSSDGVLKSEWALSRDPQGKYIYVTQTFRDHLIQLNLDFTVSFIRLLCKYSLQQHVDAVFPSVIRFLHRYAEGHCQQCGFTDSRSHFSLEFEILHPTHKVRVSKIRPFITVWLARLLTRGHALQNGSQEDRVTHRKHLVNPDTKNIQDVESDRVQVWTLFSQGDHGQSRGRRASC